MGADSGHPGATPARTPHVLVVAYRADDHLAGCLRQLGTVEHVTVIDNDNSTKTRSVVESAGVGYIATPNNVGFAAAVNLGLAACWDGVSDVLLLNPDARIGLSEVARLQQALRAQAVIAAVSPRLIDEVGRPQRAEWPLPSPGQAWMEAFGLGRFWRGPRFVIGAVLLLRGEALAQIGGFDERYFLYAEEADWQLRAHRAGWTVAVVDDVIATHAGGASSSDAETREGLFHASFERFTRRWYGNAGWVITRLAVLIAAARRSVIGSRENRLLGRRTLRRHLRGQRGGVRGRARAGGG